MSKREMVREGRVVKQHNWRTLGMYFAPEDREPRNSEPRRGGPPPLFISDIRTTILVNLALAGGHRNQRDFMRHIGKRNQPLIDRLVTEGFIHKWSAVVPNSRRKIFIELDDAHPVAAELLSLLLRIATVYPGYVAMPNNDESAALVRPERTPRTYDLDLVFGKIERTASLVFTHIADGASTQKILKAVPGTIRRTVALSMWMYVAFGILATKSGPNTAINFVFVKEHPLHEELRALVAAVERLQPQWRAVFREQESSVGRTTSRVHTSPSGRANWARATRKRTPKNAG